MLSQEKWKEEIKRIEVWSPPGDVQVKNPTDLPLIGRGHQGAVFKVGESQCVKVYCKETTADREYHALRLGDEAGICPRVYDRGPHWVLMEYLDAPTLSDHLQSNPLSEEISRRILDLLETMERIGYTRLDHSPRHIFLMPDGSLRIIDVVHSIKRNGEMKLLAKKLLKELGSQAPVLIDHTKRLNRKIYRRWVRHPDFKATMARAVEPPTAAEDTGETMAPARKSWWRRLISR